MKKLILPVLLAANAILVASLAQATTFTGVDGKTIEISNPQRVVAINSTLVEIIFALRKQSSLVGADQSALFPVEAQKLAKVGHPYRPSVEGIISLKPDLVLATEENLPKSTAEQLRSAKIPLLILENSAKDGIKGLERRVDTVSQIFQSTDDDKELKRRLQDDLSTLKVETAKFKQRPKVLFLYAHGPGEAMVYGKNTGSHVLIELTGGTNAADFTSGTKPLTAEAMVAAAPDVIIMLERGLKAVGGVEGALKLPGVALTPAGKTKMILSTDNSIRWVGLRFPQFASSLVKQMGSPNQSSSPLSK